MMQAVKFEGEEAFVTEAIGLAEERFDFVVDAFHASVADAVLPPGEDAAGVAQQGLSEVVVLASALQSFRPGENVRSTLDQQRHVLRVQLANGETLAG